MRLGEREFSTEQVAKMCGVTRVTVADWIRKGRLAARVTNGGHRRVARRSLHRFLSAQGYEVPPPVGQAGARVAVFAADHAIEEATRACFLRDAQCTVARFEASLPSLIDLGSWRADAWILEGALALPHTREMLRACRDEPSFDDVVCVVVAEREDRAALRRLGADVVVDVAGLRAARPRIVEALNRRQRRA